MHACLSLTLGPSGHRTHLKRLDRRCNNLWQQPSFKLRLNWLSQATQVSAAWTVLVFPATRLSIGGRYPETCRRQRDRAA